MPVVIKAKRGQAGTWKRKKAPIITTININSHEIKKNIPKNPEEREPPIKIVQKKEKHYVHQLEIPVPCRLVYNSDKPLECGARVWIEILNFDLDLIAS